MILNSEIEISIEEGEYLLGFYFMLSRNDDPQTSKLFTKMFNELAPQLKAQMTKGEYFHLLKSITDYSQLLEEANHQIRDYVKKGKELRKLAKKN
jgi:hypothetical protein